MKLSDKEVLMDIKWFEDFPRSTKPTKIYIHSCGNDTAAKEVYDRLLAKLKPDNTTYMPLQYTMEDVEKAKKAWTVDEWLESDAAKRDALKFKNGCYIISGRRCGKKSYYKELLNSVYGYNKKPPYDDMPDTIRYLMPEIDILKRKEETKEMSTTRICSNIELTADLYSIGRLPYYDAKIFINVDAFDDRSGMRIIVTYIADGHNVSKHIVRIKDVDIMQAYHANKALFDFVSTRIYVETGGQVVIKDYPVSHSRIRGIVEMYDFFKSRTRSELNAGIENVIFNDPATIVEWKDGSKTVVQARDGEKFDPEKGLAMAISKKALGNKHDYYHVFKKWLKKAPEQVSGTGKEDK